MQDLCEEAGTNRRTFYYHFHDKYDLVAWIIGKYSLEDSTAEPEFGVRKMERTFARMAEQRLFYKKVLDDPNIINLNSYMIVRSADHYEKEVKRITGKKELSEDESFSIRMFVYGMINMQREWLEKGCPEDAATLTRRIVANMPTWLSDLLEVK